MASDIQTLAPSKNNNNMNFISNKSVVYDILSTNNFHLHDFAVYGEHHHDYLQFNSMNGSSDGMSDLKFAEPNINLTNSDMVKFPYSMPPPPFKMVNYNNSGSAPNNKSFDRRDRLKSRDNFRSKSPKGYESDESGTSYSSRGTPEVNGIKSKRRDDENNSNHHQNEYYRRYNNSRNGLQPNLYQPNVNYNQKRFDSHGSTQQRVNKHPNRNSDVMVRRAHGLMERFKSRAYKMRVDAHPANLLNGGPCDHLNQAIWDVFLSKIQTEDTYIRKLNLWRSIFLFIRKCLNSYGLFLVGSTMSGFALDGSDIDMCLLTKPYIVTDPRVDSVHHLTHLRQLLLKSGIASEAELIMAKVPILKFKNKETGFEIDLNCNNAVGIWNTHLLHCYSQLDWRVRPLVAIVKIWAQANNINDAKNMTISSYSWVLMVIHFLQCGVTPPVLPCLHGLVPEKFNSNYENHSMDVQEELDIIKNFESDNTSCLGDLLILFFRYYSLFNYSQYAISVRAGSRLPIDECRFCKSPKNDPNQWKCLCIEEPFDYTNTARSVFDPEVFKHIKEIILRSYKDLVTNKSLNCILPVNLDHQR